ncbi:putative aldose-1-epimerase [Arthrobacter sp. DR-2P]|uniref:aldose 1-epimerase family protein n=2 Tax=Micrococcaceae TaxID=1268 RepID=UPI0010F37421|nr:MULTISPECIES: aldose 1-epimerase family protein [unclassified Arthrobacter]VII97939.1 putative aldose-1-epimerase [Arthrobacter sp. DR-2P]
MPVMSRLPLSGRQIDLEHGPYMASLATVGASLRTLRFKGRDLVLPYAADDVRPAYRGAILAPWPNRVTDGRYSFNGVRHQLNITEPQRGHALHGLLVWQDWSIDGATGSSVTLSCTLVAQQGYPFPLHVQARYTLDETGLTTTVSALNIGPGAAPYGVAAHPYLVAGEGTVNDWTLELPAEKMLQVTEDRLVPTGLADVGGPGAQEYDFRQARPIGSLPIDHAFTGLTRNPAGQAALRLTRADGTGTAMIWGEECPWVQIHTADAPEAGARHGLAVEPMTCPPNAFNSTTDLHILQPGNTHTARWTIQAIDQTALPSGGT